MQSMNELSLHFLQDVYDAEKRAVRSLQKMARAASNDRLKQAMTANREQNDGQVARLEHVFELVTGKRPRGKACAAMIGLVTEVDEAIKEGEKGPVLDAALIACAQAIEHYGMARYGAMATWMRQSGKEEVAALLHTTLEEKKQNDVKLTGLAEGEVHPEAPVEEKGGEEPAEAPAPAPRRGRAAAQKAEGKAEEKAEEKPAAKPGRRSAAKPAATPEPEPEAPPPKPARRRGKQEEPAPEPEPPAPKGRRARK